MKSGKTKPTTPLLPGSATTDADVRRRKVRTVHRDNLRSSGAAFQQAAECHHSRITDLDLEDSLTSRGRNAVRTHNCRIQAHPRRPQRASCNDPALTVGTTAKESERWKRCSSSCSLPAAIDHDHITAEDCASDPPSRSNVLKPVY